MSACPDFLRFRILPNTAKTHHSQSDTFDKVWSDDLNQGAEVLAAWAYNTAQLPAMLPRRAPGFTPEDESKNQTGPAAKPDPVADMDTKILAQVKTDEPELKANLQFMTDHIGPRLTGSPELAQASRWMLEQFQALGLDKPHQEPWTIANPGRAGPRLGACF